MEEQPKRGPGRPRVETTMPPQWYEIIIEAGKNGKHITEFLITLGICWETHRNLLKRNKKYLEAFNRYNLLCEQWWYERAHEAIENQQSNKFNQRLWAIVMSNKFRENWREKQVDLTTQGDKIKEDNPIQIEIIRKSIDGESNL